MKPSPSLNDAPLVDNWIQVSADGKVEISTGKVEIGQHIGHSLQLIVAEELNLPLDRVQLRSADTAHSPDEGYTSGSNSVQHSGEALRAAAASARSILSARAAVHFGVTAELIDCTDGWLRNRGTNEAINFAEAMAGEPFNERVDTLAATVASTELRQVGQPAIAQDMAGIVSGHTRFVHDLQWPGMLHARVVRPPHYHARLKRAPTSLAASNVDCSVLVDGSFVAVTGADEYSLVRAVEKLAAKLEWEEGGGLATDDVFERLYDAPRQSRSVVDGTPVAGPVRAHPQPPTNAHTTLSAQFERPYQMHASIGPSAAAALYMDGQLTLWSATQGIFPLRGAIAETLAMDEAKVRVIHVPGAGCYGHNGADDAALDAALAARANQGRHILLKWTRAQEHAWEPYAPCMGVKLRASLDAGGQIIDWCHDSFGDTHRARPRTGPGGVGPARLLAARHIGAPASAYVPTPNMARHAGNHRNADPLYAFTQRSISKHLVSGLPLRTSAMRTLGAFANVFAIESFMDELASAAGMDAVKFRLQHLQDKRAREVLERVAANAGWNTSNLPVGEALGIGIAQYKNAQAYAAACIHLQVDDAGQTHLKHAWLVADAGRVVDPDGLATQMEGGLIQATSWALYEAVEHDERGITSLDWDSYRIARFSDLPRIEVELIDRPEQPSVGAGEASSGPVGAAIANAIARATGVRPRRMPFTPDNLRAQALRE
jgi:nicotinate dehydrogenase subunit B